MSRWVSARALVLVTLVAGCADEELQSELDTEGPPRVTLVSLGDESGETAIYCPDEDADKISVLCLDGAGNYSFDPEAVGLAAPVGGSVRLVFNELLDPDRAEELVQVRDELGNPAKDPYGNAILRGTLVNSQPVILTCNEQPVAYDGFYNPSGNHLSRPPGPSLVIRPVEAMPTGASCTVTVAQGETNPGFGVFDKSGNPVSAADRGPFSFQIAPLAITGASPANELEGVDVGFAPSVTFNVEIVPASLDGEDGQRVRLRTAADDVDVAATLAVDGNTVMITPASPLAPETAYEVVVYSGIAESGGGTLALETDPFVATTFTTGTPAPASAN
jgi:hypothetical protein